ncbi:MAG TPA: PEP-CTERM sorting domain-containing protein [Micropepsaceae bacterium]|nr:PEP-CTERM sorting domain-containing protein [Micropepsaceae bacterium]
MQRVISVFGAAFAFAMMSGTAMAQTPPAVPVPEPASIAVFAAGAAGAYVLRKWTKRK